ncbi:MAG: type IV conjugative transfer system protein TraE [Novosphingobium sp.]|nr:type IV conjugative transfer system protein TraE [Novosphingobium sp.]
MRLDWLRSDLAGARRASTLLAILLAVSMLATLLLAIHTLRQAGRERVVVVPPAIHKTFWVEAERVSPEYLEQMGYFLAQLTLNVTPQSVEHQSRLLLQYAAPASWGELRTAMAANAERIKRDGASTVFSPQDLQVDERTQRVGLRGLLTTFISDRRVSEVSKGYAIELQYAGGRIYLKTFRETNPNDPLELQTRSGAAPASPSGPTSDASSPAAAPAVPAGAPAR